MFNGVHVCVCANVPCRHVVIYACILACLFGRLLACVLESSTYIYVIYMFICTCVACF